MRKWIVLLTLISLMGCTSMAMRGGASRVVSNYQEGDYQESISIADRVLHVYDYDDTQKAMISYYKALSLEALNRVEEAKGLYEYIKTTYPSSEYAFMSGYKLSLLNKQ